MAGPTSTGFELPTLDEILSSMKQAIWDNISDKIDLSPESPDGQFLAILAEREFEQWKGQLVTWQNRRPRDASGAALNAVCAFTGTRRKSATKTQVPACTVNVNPGAYAPGSLIAHKAGDPTARFVNKATVTNGGGVAANFSADFEAETAGPIEILAGELIVIAEAVAGWNSITNPTDGTTGDPDEEDGPLRVRREEELQGQGSRNIDAIRADVLRNLSDNVTNCAVLENEGDSVNADGLPGHSIEVIARGIATDSVSSDRLVKQIFLSKGGGTQTYSGNATYRTVIDSKGNAHSIGYSWVNVVPVYLGIDITVTSDYPADGDSQLIEAILAIEAGYDPGDTVVAEFIKSKGFTITGIKDVPALRLGLTPAPVGTVNLAMTKRQIADFDSTRIVINHV